MNGSGTSEILILEPFLIPRLWGGKKLIEDWGYEATSDIRYGECWCVSAVPGNESMIISGAYKGRTLRDLWSEEKHLFGDDTGNEFPLLTKLIDADDNTSIQVHPDDAYARVHEDSYGKTECWYIVDCPEGATLPLGNNAADREELISLINNKAWDKLLTEVPVKKGDCVQITAGVMHALQKGFVVLETQQSSDITYRIYDYDRLSGGVKRELHIKQGLDVITTGKSYDAASVCTPVADEGELKTLVTCDKYTVWELKVSESYVINEDRSFLIASVIEGEGYAGDIAVSKGMHFIIPADMKSLTLKGHMTLILSSPVRRRV